MANTENSILGDINPTAGRPEDEETESGMPVDEETESMSGGSKHDKARHSGTRDVTEGTTGGTGTEVGGTRNYRQGTGATGGDIGNRPE
jgi:hypothetical protein